MAKYLTNKETQAAIERIIMTAAKTLVLVSPYISLTGIFLSRIKAAAEKGVHVKTLYRLDQVKDEELNRLKNVKNIELKFVPDLHAKCYFNEKEMVITSMNLLETSEKNWEMGIHVSRVSDKDIFEAAMTDVQTIFMDSSTFKNDTPKTKFKTQKRTLYASRPKLNEGYCIRCSDNIKYSINKPLCSDCFESWDEWGNVEYSENFCHFSGEPSFGETSYARPILRKNWERARVIHRF